MKPPDVVIEDAEFEPLQPLRPAARLLPPPGALVAPAPAQALQRGVPAPSVDPVTVYLSRYTSKNSRQAMVSSLKVVARLLTGREVDPREVPWHEVRYTHAQLVRTKLAEEYAVASANRHLLALRGIVRECWQLGLVEHEVTAQVDRVGDLKDDQKEHGRALSEAEVSKLFAACDQSPRGLRDAAALALTVGAGLRRSEVCDLQLEHWLPAESRLKVFGKGAVWRSAHISLKRGAVLGAWVACRGQHPGPLICRIDKHGVVQPTQALTSSMLYELLRALGERAGVADFTPHDLRRTFITRLLEKGADALTVSKLVGHKNIETTKKYDKRGEESKRAAVALLDGD